MVEVFDDVVDEIGRRQVYEFAVNSLYSLGKDGDDYPDVVASRRVLHSVYSPQDVQNSGLLQSIKSKPLRRMMGDRPVRRALMNLAEPANVYTPHSHPEDTLVYYVNTRWQPEWAGETIVYKSCGAEIERAVAFKPGRALWIGRGVKHSLRPPSHQAPFYRFTFALFFEE